MKMIPDELLYTDSHEWVRVEDDGTLTVGITHHAQELLGDLVYIELPEANTEFSGDEEIGVVESVKAASDIFCPISGEIIEINEALFESPELVNKEPYGKGWLYKLEPFDEDDLKELLSPEKYKELIQSEAH